VSDLVANEAVLKQLNPKNYVSEQLGELTIRDILKELGKPGLDPRSELEQFEYAAIYKMEDVKLGMVVPGMVTNITRFGAFVDIGVKQDGLVHVSEISHQYITDPNEALKLNDKVLVKVLEVDLLRKRIALSIKQTQEAPTKTARPQRNQQPQKSVQTQEQDLSSMDVTDALALLKKRFGK
jgi:uncharacterized protein